MAQKDSGWPTDSYHRILQNAVVGWGDDTGAEFTFIPSRA